MHKYLTLLGTSLIIFLAFFAVSTHNVSATVVTGNACSESDVQNWINTNTDTQLDWNIFGHHPDCTPSPTPTITPSVTPTPTVDPCANGACVTPTPTQAPSNNGGNGGGPGDGRSDGLGCGSHDCSGNPQPSSQAVLGAATGPQVLGLSTTGGEENFIPQLLQILAAATAGGLGLVFFKKNA